MKSWTSIPFYLWKNTFSRWFEYPVSPFSKILIPALLGFLSIIVLALFAEVENELRRQLETNSVFTVYSSEFIPNENATLILRKSYEEELMWEQRFGRGVVRQVRQPLVSATVGFTRNAPILAFTEMLDDGDAALCPASPPVIWLLRDAPAGEDPVEQVAIARTSTVATVREVPPWIRRVLSMEIAVAVPIVLIEPYLHNGFILHTVAELDSIEAVEQYVREISAYYRAEQRHPKIVSALEILKNLERISMIQAIVRSLIVIGCGIILALTLGSIAWLEYRQESYLIALLKSFGTPSSVLLVHMFLENLLLVMGGVSIALLGWQRLHAMAAPHLQSIGLESTTPPVLATADMGIILLAGVVGVLMAMLPVAIGLRKPAGLILQ